jgi:hypothetical protein
MPKPAQVVNALGLRHLASSFGGLESHTKDSTGYHYHISANVNPQYKREALMRVRRPVTMNYRGHIYRWHPDHVTLSGNHLSFSGHAVYQGPGSRRKTTGKKRRSTKGRKTTRRTATYRSPTKHSKRSRTSRSPSRRLPSWWRATA